MMEEVQYKLVSAQIGSGDYVWNFLYMEWNESSGEILPDCTPTETAPCTESFTLKFCGNVECVAEV